MNELGLLATGQWIRLILSCEHSHTHTRTQILGFTITTTLSRVSTTKAVTLYYLASLTIMTFFSLVHKFDEWVSARRLRNGGKPSSLSLSSPLPPPPLHPPPPPTTPQLIHPARIALIHLHKHEKTVGIAWAELVTCKEWDPQTCWWWDRGNHNT